VALDRSSSRARLQIASMCSPRAPVDPPPLIEAKKAGWAVDTVGLGLMPSA